MLRREFIGRCVAISSLTPCRRLAAEPPAIRSAARFFLGRGQMGFELQDVKQYEDQIVFLERDTGPGFRNHGVGCAKGSGEPLWSWDRGEVMYSFIGVRPTGTIVLVRITSTIEEYTRDGLLIRTIPARGQLRRVEVVGDFVLRYHFGGTVDSLDLRNDRVTPRVLARQLFADSTWILSDRLSNTKAAFIDGASARLAVVDLQSENVSQVGIASPEVRESLAFYARQKAAAAERGVTLNSITVQASGADRQGNLYCLISPYDPLRAAILKLSDVGAVLRKISVELPDRHTPMFGLPMKLLAGNNHLTVVFAGGGAVSYRIV